MRDVPARSLLKEERLPPAPLLTDVADFGGLVVAFLTANHRNGSRHGRCRAYSAFHAVVVRLLLVQDASVPNSLEQMTREKDALDLVKSLPKQQRSSTLLPTLGS